MRSDSCPRFVSEYRLAYSGYSSMVFYQQWVPISMNYMHISFLKNHWVYNLLILCSTTETYWQWMRPKLFLLLHVHVYRCRNPYCCECKHMRLLFSFYWTVKSEAVNTVFHSAQINIIQFLPSLRGKCQIALAFPFIASIHIRVHVHVISIHVCTYVYDYPLPIIGGNWTRMANYMY